MNNGVSGLCYVMLEIFGGRFTAKKLPVRACSKPKQEQQSTNKQRQKKEERLESNSYEHYFFFLRKVVTYTTLVNVTVTIKTNLFTPINFPLPC